jgi:hypothetical protein
MSRLRPLVRWEWQHLFWLPIALCLWPIVAHNYRQRRLGLAPDEWHWADRWLFDHSFVIY